MAYTPTSAWRIVEERTKRHPESPDDQVVRRRIGIHTMLNGMKRMHDVRIAHDGVGQAFIQNEWSVENELWLADGSLSSHQRCQTDRQQEDLDDPQ
jgi:hypothetical protein